MIRIAAVSYLNTKPFLLGLEESPLRNQLDLRLAIPSECARMLQAGEVELGLVPVAAIPTIPQAQVISDFCIGADGEVRTVAIYADCPIEQVERLYLDYHSRTSVQLAQYLLKNYWKQSPELLVGSEGFESKIEGTTAAVVIGDRTIALEKRHAYRYDLADYWKRATGLPFVFAAWVSTRPLDPAFLADFNAALRQGVERLPEVVAHYQPDYPDFDLLEYYSWYIDFKLDDLKKTALARFLDYCQLKQSGER